VAVADISGSSVVTTPTGQPRALDHECGGGRPPRTRLGELALSVQTGARRGSNRVLLTVMVATPRSSCRSRPPDSQRNRARIDRRCDSVLCFRSSARRQRHSWCHCGSRVLRHRRCVAACQPVWPLRAGQDKSLPLHRQAARRRRTEGGMFSVEMTWSARTGEEQRFTSERFNTLLSVVALLGSRWMTHGRRKLSLSGASCLSAGGERCMALSSG